jgi:hypothetical protein
VKVADLAGKLSDAFQAAATQHPGNGAEQWKAVALAAVDSLDQVIAGSLDVEGDEIVEVVVSQEGDEPGGEG